MSRLPSPTAARVSVSCASRSRRFTGNGRSPGREDPAISRSLVAAAIAPVIDCGYSGAWQPCAFVVLPDLLPDVPLSRRTTRAVVRSRR